MKQNSPLNILLADDDTDDRYFFKKALEELAIETKLTTVNNGEELMTHLTLNPEAPPDVLFLDLSMPRKTGFECLIEIKENKMLKNFFVIMYSTSFTKDIYLEQSLINTLRKMGAEDYIRKPGDFELLKQSIHEVLTRMMEKIGQADKE